MMLMYIDILFNTLDIKILYSILYKFNFFLEFIIVDDQRVFICSKIFWLCNLPACLHISNLS